MKTCPVTSIEVVAAQIVDLWSDGERGSDRGEQRDSVTARCCVHGRITGRVHDSRLNQSAGKCSEWQPSAR